VRDSAVFFFILSPEGGTRHFPGKVTFGHNTAEIGLTLNRGNARGIDFERYRIARD
jgi:hypothetical protein